jgi:hypothetical protein
VPNSVIVSITNNTEIERNSFQQDRNSLRQHRNRLQRHGNTVSSQRFLSHRMFLSIWRDSSAT